MTLQQRYKVWLEAIGFKQIEHRTRKYIVMEGQATTCIYWLFLGKAGSIRLSENRNLKGSISVSDSFKPKLLKWERKQNEN